MWDKLKSEETGTTSTDPLHDRISYVEEEIMEINDEIAFLEKERKEYEEELQELYIMNTEQYLKGSYENSCC